MARRGVTKGRKRAGARKAGARGGTRKRAAARKGGARGRKGARKKGTRAAGRKTTRRGAARKAASRTRRGGAGKGVRRPAVPPVGGSSQAGAMSGGGRDRDETSATEKLFAGAEERDTGDMGDEDLQK